MTDYISSSAIRDYFSVMDTQPFVYHYDDVDVIIKNIPLGETDIRFDTLRGGNTPSYMFVGVIPQKCLMGDLEQSSTGFHANMVNEMNITYNGNSVNGYPIKIDDASPVYPLHKFNDTINKMCNITSGSGFTPQEFNGNFIWSHHFEAESTTSGWLGINFKLKTGFSTSHSLVVWLVNPTTIAVDKFHIVEKLNN